MASQICYRTAALGLVGGRGSSSRVPVRTRSSPAGGPGKGTFLWLAGAAVPLQAASSNSCDHAAGWQTDNPPSLGLGPQGPQGTAGAA